MKEDKLYIDYIPGIWYGADSEPPVFCDCVIILEHVERRNLRVMKIATHPSLHTSPEYAKDPEQYGIHEGWLIRDFATEPEWQREWTVTQWLMLPAPFYEEDEKDG